MGIGNLGFGEIMLVLLVILLFFGAKRIPEIAGSFGKGIREFKRSMTDVERQIVTDALRRQRVQTFVDNLRRAANVTDRRKELTAAARRTES